MAPEIAGFLDKLKTVKITNKKGFGFGSYGWFGNVPKMISTKLQEAGMALLTDEKAICYTPTEQDLETLEQLGEQFAEILKQ